MIVRLNQDQLEGGENQREYFRAQGYVYTLVQPLNKEKRLYTFSGSDLPESVDPVDLKFMNFRSKLHYSNPSQAEYFLEMLNLLEVVYNEQENKSVMPRLTKEWVNISASGMDIETMLELQPGEKVICTVGLPDYPFETLNLLSEVVHCTPHSIREGYFMLGIAFHNVSEFARQSLIKFVNQLQRKKNSKKSDPAS